MSFTFICRFPVVSPLVTNDVTPDQANLQERFLLLSFIGITSLNLHRHFFRFPSFWPTSATNLVEVQLSTISDISSRLSMTRNIVGVVDQLMAFPISSRYSEEPSNCRPFDIACSLRWFAPTIHHSRWFPHISWVVTFVVIPIRRLLTNRTILNTLCSQLTSHSLWLQCIQIISLVCWLAVTPACCWPYRRCFAISKWYRWCHIGCHEDTLRYCQTLSICSIE